MPVEPTDHIAKLLDAWRQEQPELDTAPIAVAGRILRAARYLTAEIERELERFGLGIQEFNCLSALRRAGEPYELTPTDLSRALLFSSGGLTKLIERLERAGLVERSKGEHDRRVVLVRLTAAGRELQETAMQAHLLNEDELLSALDEADRAVIATTLARLLAAFERGEGRQRPLVRAPRASATIQGGSSR